MRVVLWALSESEKILEKCWYEGVESGCGGFGSSDLEHFKPGEKLDY